MLYQDPHKRSLIYLSQEQLDLISSLEGLLKYRKPDFMPPVKVERRNKNEPPLVLDHEDRRYFLCYSDAIARSIIKQKFRRNTGKLPVTDKRCQDKYVPIIAYSEL